MALIGNLSDIPNLELVPEGEYDLEIVSAKEKTFESGARAINLVLHVIGEENAEAVYHTLWLPVEDDDSTKVTNKLRMLKDFMEAIGMTTDEEHEAEDFKDVTFSGMLGVQSNYKNPDKMENFLIRVT